MSFLIYNGVSLPFVHTEGGDYRSIYTPDGADYLHTEITYTITSLLEPSIPGLLLPGETIAMAFKRIQDALGEPRKSLKVLFGSNIIDNNNLVLYVNSDDPNASVDQNKGPKPEVLAITEMTGDRSIMVRFRITTYINECSSNGNPPDFISNRWEDSVRILDDSRSVVTRRGRLYIRSGTGRTPDDFRGMVTPPIPYSFVPISSQYTVQEDGKALDYEIVREERWAMPPPPSVKAEGSFFISTPSKGTILWGGFSIKLTGHIYADKNAMIATAVSICVDRIKKANAASSDPQGRWIIGQARVWENMYGNEIEVSLTVKLKPPRDIEVSTTPFRTAAGIIAGTIASLVSPVLGVAVIAKTSADALTPDAKGNPPTPLPKGLLGYGFGQKPLYSEDGSPPPDPGLRSTAGLSLVAAALNDPCLSEAILQANPNPDVPAGVASLSTNPATVSTITNRPKDVPTPPIPSATISLLKTLPVVPVHPPDDAPFISIYSYYTINIRYFTDQNISCTPEQVQGGKTYFTPLAAATMKVEVVWACEGVGEMIKVPDKYPTDPNFVLLEDECEPGTPQRESNGYDLRFEASGRYLYGVVDPSKVKYRSGVTPDLAWSLRLLPLAHALDGPEFIDFGKPPPSSSTGPSPDPAGLQISQLSTNVQPLGMFEAWRSQLAAWVAAATGQ